MAESIYFSNDTFRTVTYMMEPYGMTYEVPPNGEITFSLKGQDITGPDQLELAIADDVVQVWFMGKYDVHDVIVSVLNASQIAERQTWRRPKDSLSHWDRRKFFQAEIRDAEARIAILTSDSWSNGDRIAEATAERVAELRATIASLTAIVEQIE